ncbi:MAG: ATP-dependent metallopeptidase FtsH/Yme1/Tma family protein, partial [Eubacterium sp.]|nr:ATP-dependent metallopeptidase FtsH/Yme1/Tma family protein [Eubacterium sp.]
MKRLNRSYKNLIALILLVVLFYFVSGYFSDRLAMADDAYTGTQFYKDLSEDKVDTIHIYQNEEVPTGSVTVTLKEDAKRSYTFYVADVNTVMDKVEQAGADYVLLDVKR